MYIFIIEVSAVSVYVCKPSFPASCGTLRKTSRLDTNSDLLCLDWIQWRIWRLSYRKPRWLRLESFDFGWPGREAPQIKCWSGQWQACNGSNHGHLISERSFRYNWPWNVDPSTLGFDAHQKAVCQVHPMWWRDHWFAFLSATNSCKKRPYLEATELAMKFHKIASLHWNCFFHRNVNAAPRVKNRTVQSPEMDASATEEIHSIEVSKVSSPDCAAALLPGKQRPASRGQSVKAEQKHPKTF